MKNRFLILAVIIFAVSTLFFWHRANTLSDRLELIKRRIGQSRQEVIETRKIVTAEPLYKASAAIVLDDFGYNLRNVKDVWALEAPVTLSILPNLPYSRTISLAAREHGFEHILHLPLEPHENRRLEKRTIMISMTDEEVAETLKWAMLSVPGLAGISNHMGSKGTEDKRVMSTIFRQMKTDNLYFLDSLVTNKSICARASREIGIRFAARSVFLDNKTDPDYIAGQITEMADKALAAGSAIGIGHDRPLTISVIKEMLPELKRRGIRLVPASELAE